MLYKILNALSDCIEMSGFAHNYQIVSSFEENISGFENTVVELKDVSAICHFFKNIRNKGLSVDSDGLVVASDMA